MLQIQCSGSPHEIGRKHGEQARAQVGGTIAFYASLFHQTAKIDWPRVREIAAEFEPVIRQKWPSYLDEMQGLAEGAGVELIDIIAINVRTEINFGLFSDGCTALSWKTPQSSFLAQNWDWMEAQQENLILLTIAQPNKPTIKMVTEAGLIGKIGLNSSGVGVCLNAIRAKGMDSTRIPCHLGLRLVLECNTRDEAVAALDDYGVASACHMLVADPTGGIGLEWSSIGCGKLTMSGKGQVFHSNHYLVAQPGVKDTNWLEDSEFRVTRIEELSNNIADPDVDTLQDLFKDEMNYPAAICRRQEGLAGAATLFNIVMDLKARKAKVALGRPIAPVEELQITF